MLKYLIPLIIYIIISVFLALGLDLKPKEIPSPLIGKPAPAFTLPVLARPQQQLTQNDFLGQVWLLNVWASWCVSCREEHPLLLHLAKQNAVTLVGLNYKDETADANRWLETQGNPYGISVQDVDGRIGIDYGVYGVPETFVIDKRGVIRYKLTGPLDNAILDEKILPMIKELQAEPV